MVEFSSHADDHADPEELPLVTESARVVDVAALDENRTEEIRPVAARLLGELGRGDLVTDETPVELDWDGLDALLDDPGDVAGTDELENLRYLAERYHRAYPSLLSIELRAEDEPIDFVPGQYVTIRFHDTPRPYSVASAPNDDTLEFCLRRVPGGRLTSDLFVNVEPGEEVVVRGPNGDFVLEDPSERDVAFVATGTGVAPLRSMIQYLFEEGRDVYDGDPRDVWLFFGCSWRDDLPYHDWFTELDEARDNFHYVPTLSRETYLSDWDGETNYVQETFVRYLVADADAVAEPDLDDDLGGVRAESPATDIDARIDPANLELYACGLSAMMERLVNVVARVGVADEHVHGESYG